jgi:hypothetical protein
MKLLNWKTSDSISVPVLVSKTKLPPVAVAVPTSVRTKPAEFERFFSKRTEFLQAMKNAGYISETEFNANTMRSTIDVRV